MSGQTRGDDAANHAPEPSGERLAEQPGQRPQPPAQDTKRSDQAAKTLPVEELDASNDE